MESRTQGSRPTPRTQKKSEAKAKDSFSEDGHSRGQGQECSRPRPKDQGHKRKSSAKKNGLHKNFSGDLQKKRSSHKFFRRSPQKNVFQNIFQALHKIFKIQKIVLSSSRGQGLQDVSSRPRTSSRTPPLMDSTNLLHFSTITFSWYHTSIIASTSFRMVSGSSSECSTFSSTET